MSDLGVERLMASLADRCQIERELGAGGMATVYLAQDLKHDRQVAVKVFKPELAAERFLADQGHRQPAASQPAAAFSTQEKPMASSTTSCLRAGRDPARPATPGRVRRAAGAGDRRLLDDMLSYSVVGSPATVRHGLEAIVARI
jgi:serine/threonine protein kinase